MPKKPAASFAAALDAASEALLDRMPEPMRELAVALSHPIPPLPPKTPAEQDVAAVLALLEETVLLQLTAYEAAFPDEVYCGRFFVYTRSPKSGAWQQRTVEYADPAVLAPQDTTLEELAVHLQTEFEEVSVAVWAVALSGIPGRLTPAFLYVRHVEGLYQVHAKMGQHLRRIPLPPATLYTAVSQLGPRKKEQSYWTAVLKTLTALAQELIRPETERWFKAQGVVEFTDAHWDALMEQFYLNTNFMRMLLEVGRSAPTPLMAEAQRCLEFLVNRVVDVSNSRDERLAQAEKDYQRELKRRLRDFEKLQLAYAGLQQRAQRQDEALLRLRRELRAAAGSGAPAPSETPSRTLATALRTLFVDDPRGSDGKTPPSPVASRGG